MKMPFALTLVTLSAATAQAQPKSLVLSDSSCQLQTFYNHAWTPREGVSCKVTSSDLTNAGSIVSANSAYSVTPYHDAGGNLMLKVAFAADKDLRQHILSFSQGEFSVVVDNEQIQPISPGSTNQE